MSHDFNLRFNEMKHSDPTQRESAVSSIKNQYESNSNVRNICFIWPDNSKRFINYAYLISGEYLPEDSTIILTFTSHVVQIKGSHLESLFDDFQTHLPRNVVCLGERYQHLADDSNPSIKEITIISND